MQEPGNGLFAAQVSKKQAAPGDLGKRKTEQSELCSVNGDP